MADMIFQYNGFIWGIVGLGTLGIIVKMVLSGIYGKLIKESDNMGNSEHALMKLLKLKFEACYKLKMSVNNVDTFVDRYVYKHKFGGIHLYTWDNIGGQILMICILVGITGIGLGVISQQDKAEILSTFFVGIIAGIMLIVVDEILNISSKKEVFRINVKDYLENNMKSRLESEYFHYDEYLKYQREYFSEKEDIKNASHQESDEDVQMLISSLKDGLEEKKHNQRDEKIIEDILQEFLV